LLLRYNYYIAMVMGDYGKGGMGRTDTSGSAVNISSFSCSSLVEKDGGEVVVVLVVVVVVVVGGAGGSQELIRRWEVARVRVARVKMVVGEVGVGVGVGEGEGGRIGLVGGVVRGW